MIFGAKLGRAFGLWALCGHSFAPRGGGWGWIRSRKSSGKAAAPSPRQRLDAANTALTASIGHLNQLPRELEERFLAATSDLEKLPSASTELVTHSEQLLGLASGKIGGEQVLNPCVALLGEPLSFLDTWLSRTEELIGHLDYSVHQIRNLRGNESALGGTFAPLTYIQVLIRIESASLDVSVQQMFEALVSDIQDLRSRVSERFASEFKGLHDTEITLARLRDLLATVREAHSVAIAGKRAAIDQALHDVRVELETYMHRDLKLAAASKRVHSLVGDLVVQLQTQDITSQKIAHVRENLEILTPEISAALGRDDGEATTRQLVFVEKLARLQLAQLIAAGRDIDLATTTFESALNGVLDQAGELRGHCTNLPEFATVTVGADGLIQVLLDAIEDLRQVTSEAEQRATEAHEVVKPVGGNTSNVTQQMRELAAQMKLIALNAQVQAARIANGTGLEALAARTADIANATRGVGEEIAEQLQMLSIGLDNFVTEFDQLSQHGRAMRTMLDTAGGELEHQLHAHRDHTLEEFAHVLECGNQVTTVTEQIRAQLQFGVAPSDSLKPVSDLLGEIADAAAALLATRPPLQDPTQDPRLEKILSRYTMASERMVHGGQQATGTTGTTAAEADALLFDAFDLPETAASVPTPSTPPSAPDAGAETNSENDSKAHGRNADAQALGANVDLF
jgi:hypothetical protein